jgi:alanine dehydrogenase
MKIGIPKELKNHEYRVGATPHLVESLIKGGQQVYVETGAGAKVGYLDSHYVKVGAKIAANAQEVYACDLVIKVKEPQPEEYLLLREGLVLFCYLHLAANQELTRVLVERKVTAIAFETVETEHRTLPLLAPMSDIAGRISVQAGATSLEMENGGRGVLLAGTAGVRPGRVVVIGGGVLGTGAAQMAMGLGAQVTLLDNRVERLKELDTLFLGRLQTYYSTPASIREAVLEADLLIGAVLIPGKKAPKLVSRELVSEMRPGTAIVDPSIDQGGCIETSRPTTHSQPRYIEEGVVHYCVTNMPGACARTATEALSHALFPYMLELVHKGVVATLLENKEMLLGLNTYKGKVTHPQVAEDTGYSYEKPKALL